MQLAFADSLHDLDARIEPFLAERPERNVAATLLWQARSGALADTQLLFAWGTAGDGRIAFFAMRTPPWPML